MCTAEITNKQIVNGLLRLTIKFSDGAQSHTEVHDTRSTGASVVNDIILDRLTNLEALTTMMGTITLGAFTPTAPTPDPARELYKTRLAQFRLLKMAVEHGIIESTNQTFVALRTWLKNNFNESYSDLF